MMRGPDCATLLARALSASATAAGIMLGIEASRSTAWHSATFAGARHLLDVSAPREEAVDRWLAALPEADLPLRRHLVADITVTQVDRAADRTRFTVEALTVSD